MGSCAAPSAKGDDKFITTDYLQQCPPALMPELLVLALAAAGRVPDDGCFAAAAAHNVVVSKNIQD
ncbi:hypothetical protein [Providencia stuartii]|uniref:hypothetical protein n=1 Tax=Providencia stuartii TaxID=588 RepID=UPI0024AA6113|nr:hypothetical protein [Providencia stuartii]MBW3103208.1 hypothetical protein [Providencia stuartii]MCB5219781.1 hypothetical protein [Providencia stuartii]